MVHSKLVSCVSLAVGIAGSANAYLLLQPAYSYSAGYTVGDSVGHFQVFQQFDVTDPAWDITTIGLDGFLVADPDHGGALVRLMRDDGLGNPDETTNLGQKRFDFSPTGGSSHWVDEAFNDHLDAGRYWLRISPSGNTYWGAIYNSNIGLHGFSRSGAGDVFPNGFAIVMRIDGTPVPEPATLLPLVAGFALLLRRRR